MDEMPFGIGMGAIDGVVPPHNKYYFVSICPSDSSLVCMETDGNSGTVCVFGYACHSISIGGGSCRAATEGL